MLDSEAAGEVSYKNVLRQLLRIVTQDEAQAVLELKITIHRLKRSVRESMSECAERDVALAAAIVELEQEVRDGIDAPLRRIEDVVARVGSRLAQPAVAAGAAARGQPRPVAPGFRRRRQVRGRAARPLRAAAGPGGGGRAATAEQAGVVEGGVEQLWRSHFHGAPRHRAASRSILALGRAECRAGTPEVGAWAAVA